MGQLPPAVIDTKVCTFADPNGTKSRIYTQSVSASPSPPPKDEGLGPIQFKSAKGGAKLSGKYGTLEGSGSVDESGNVSGDGKAKFKYDKKKDTEVSLNGEVCVKKKNGRKDGKGSWLNYEWSWMGVNNKVGLPDGDFCAGFDSGNINVIPDGSISK
jgi:hypothetical protein